MNQFAFLLLGSLVVAACSAAGPAASGAGRRAPPAQPVQPGQAFSLRVGEVATAGSLRLGLDAVLSDSRCPKGERCITAGDARVRVWLQQGAGPRMSRELVLAPSDARGAGEVVQLLRLEPYPVSGRATAPGAYVATLVLHPLLPADGASATDAATR